MNDENLKPCPFCGSRDVHIVDDWCDEGCDCFVAYCDNCHAMTQPKEVPNNDNGDHLEPGDEDYDDVEQSVVDTWNNRNNAVDISKETVAVAEELLKLCIPLGNKLVPDEVVGRMTELEKMLKKLKDQSWREHAPISQDTVTADRLPDPEVRGTTPEYIVEEIPSVHTIRISEDPLSDLMFSNNNTPVMTPVMPEENGALQRVLDSTVRQGLVSSDGAQHMAHTVSNTLGLRSTAVLTENEAHGIVDELLSRLRNNDSTTGDSQPPTAHEQPAPESDEDPF